MKRIALLILLVVITSSATAQDPNHLWVKPDQVVYTTGEQFAELVGSYDNSGNFKFVGKRPVVVDVYWHHCKPCWYLAYTIHLLKKFHQGKIDFYTLNLETERELIDKLSNNTIKNVPVLFFITKEGHISHLVVPYSLETRTKRDPVIVDEVNKLLR